MLNRHYCGVFGVLVISVLSAASSANWGQDPEVPPRPNGIGTDPRSQWADPWDEPSWPDILGSPPLDLPDDVLPEFSRRSPKPSALVIERWPIHHPARSLRDDLRDGFRDRQGTIKRYPYHPVPRFLGATDNADPSSDFAYGPRTAGATERLRNHKVRTYSAGELLNLLTGSRMNKDENASGNGVSLRYGMSR